jgi:hypothetical protein
MYLRDVKQTPKQTLFKKITLKQALLKLKNFVPPEKIAHCLLNP